MRMRGRFRGDRAWVVPPKTRSIPCASVLEQLEPRLLFDGSPGLEAGVYIYDGGSPLQVAVMSAPTVIDWNNDGKKDLLVGQFTSGNIVLFLNQGTDANPVFSGSTLVESSGVPISTSYG